MEVVLLPSFFLFWLSLAKYILKLEYIRFYVPLLGVRSAIISLPNLILRTEREREKIEERDIYLNLDIDEGRR